MKDWREDFNDPSRSSRRRFIGNSIIGSLAMGVAQKVVPLEMGSRFLGAESDGIGIKVIGNEREGYGVTLTYRGRDIAKHNGGGEFSGVFQNGERSLEDRIGNWKATSWKGDGRRVTLTGICKLENLNCSVFAEVEYEVVDAHVVRKKIRLRQADLFLLYHQITNRLEPNERPAKFWSFDQANYRGGAPHEYFPAAGYLNTGNLCVGLLTDSGFRNQWSRIVRRDGRPVKPAPRKIPDPFLYEVVFNKESNGGEFYVQQTFGEVLEQTDSDNAGELVTLPKPASWAKRGRAGLEVSGEIVSLSTSRSADGVVIPFSARGGAVYSVRCQYRASTPFAMQIWDVDEHGEKLREITLYNDGIPESPSMWSEFHTTVFVPDRKEAGRAIYISLRESEQATETSTLNGARKIELRDLELRKLAHRRDPYHKLEMDRPVEKTVFIFVDENVPDTTRGYRIASQTRLADGLGFKGGETEKILYADLMMLCWNADAEETRPMLAPSIWYSAAGEMYLRDSFFSLNGVHNRELNESVFNLWGENQGEDGAINTLVEPNMANLERKSNDSTPLWLMWALLNRRRFSTQLPIAKIRKAAEYCLGTYDRRRDGTSWAQFVMGQLDVIGYPQGISDICENQGMLAVTLRVIRELKIPKVSENISEEYINKTEEVYRSYYDPNRKFMQAKRGVADAIGFAELFPEFLSLWLFNRKILTDEMVLHHLDRIPVLLPRPDSPHPEAQGTVRPIFIGLPESGGWSYFNEKWHPLVSDEHAARYAEHGMDGVYYNGGSWMRIEICGYVAGMLHGWKSAKQAIVNRLWAETHIANDFPTSQEYLATAPGNPFFGYHRVFAWNSFVLQALELAGMRTPDMDPDFSKG